eukprot:4688564-Prymnesium_polylepis.1
MLAGARGSSQLAPTFARKLRFRSCVFVAASSMQLYVYVCPTYPPHISWHMRSRIGAVHLRAWPCGGIYMVGSSVPTACVRRRARSLIVPSR